MIRVRTPRGEEALDLAEFEDRVLRGDLPPDTPVHFPLLTGESWVPAARLETFRGLYRPDRIYFRRYFNLSRFPWITFALVAANLLAFLLMRQAMPEEAGGPALTAWMVRFGAKAGALIDDLGQTWRFLAANFVHRDALHLAFNLLLLFNVGGALENAFRPVDYVLVLLASALGTTFVSYLGADVVSAGASGVVFGCFGGLMVFGLRHRDIIPRDYRRFFGAAVVPYVLLFLWIGWMSRGVDNWGHAGGLAAGTAAALTLKPRLLNVGRGERLASTLRAAGAAALVLLVMLGGPLWVRANGDLVPVRDARHGLELGRPRGWSADMEEPGLLAFSNGLPEPAVLQVASEFLPARTAARRAVDHWFDAQLHRLEATGRIRRVQRGPSRPARLAGRPGWLAQAAFEAAQPDGRTTGYVVRLHVLPRGRLVHTVAFLAPADSFGSYAPVFDRIAASLRLDDPEPVLQARAAARLWPADAGAWTRLGEALTAAGADDRALDALGRALALEPTSFRARLEAARLELGRPSRREAARAELAALAQARPRDPAPWLVLAEDLAAREDPEAALEALRQARRRAPDDAAVVETARVLGLERP